MQAQSSETKANHTFRPLKTIDHDLLSPDIGKIDFNLDSKNVDFIVDNYNTVFTSLLRTKRTCTIEN